MLLPACKTHCRHPDCLPAPSLTCLQSEEVQALEDQNARELMALQTAADSAHARAAAAESAASASSAKVASLTQELAAAEAALAAARQEGEEALAAAREQYEAELLQQQQKLREAKGAVRQKEEDLRQRVAALEVCLGLRGAVCLWTGWVFCRHPSTPID